MPVFLSAFQRRLHRILTIALLIAVTFFGFSTLPSYAAPMENAEEATDRAYEETEAAGIQEEIYQQRVQEGQDPEKMPQPFKRFVDAQGKEVPQTSLVETSVSKVRELTKKIAGE
ncbi:hypothetical protein IQ250_04825 [Pseudanabaenaceae cyanobacterium LEGE 13415]|nr:hypothetical protein [Pseudanabaenaceae cyanobacterium LEGE 13415]